MDNKIDQQIEELKKTCKRKGKSIFIAINTEDSEWKFHLVDQDQSSDPGYTAHYMSSIFSVASGVMAPLPTNLQREVLRFLGKVANTKYNLTEEDEKEFLEKIKEHYTSVTVVDIK